MWQHFMANASLAKQMDLLIEIVREIPRTLIQSIPWMNAIWTLFFCSIQC